MGHPIADVSRFRHRQPVVVVHALIDEEGCPQQVEVEGTVLAPVEKTVVAAVRSWVFEPAWEGGKAVARPYSTKVRLRSPHRPDTVAELMRPLDWSGSWNTITRY